MKYIYALVDRKYCFIGRKDDLESINVENFTRRYGAGWQL